MCIRDSFESDGNRILVAIIHVTIGQNQPAREINAKCQHALIPLPQLSHQQGGAAVRWFHDKFVIPIEIRILVTPIE